MILTEVKDNIQTTGQITENKVGIDARNLDFIATLLTSNLYSKPINSFLRETVANAYDSHIEAGNKEPILLLIQEIEKYYSTIRSGDSSYKVRISIRDYGTGLSPERFEEIYRNIGSSTKRDSNDFIGAFGIGRFSCLSCADQANITSYYNGKKYSYLMYKNGSGINIDAIGSPVDGDFKNGLEVSVVTKVTENTLTEALFELQFFDMLYVEYKRKDTTDSDTVSEFVKKFNDRKFSDFKYFSLSISGRRAYDKFVRMGNVLYNIDSNKFSGFFASSYIVPNVPVGSIDITPNRENVQYTDKTINAINNAIFSGKMELSNYVNNIITQEVTTIHRLYLDIVYRGQLRVKIGENLYDIYKSDINIKESEIKIRGKVIPPNFIKFLKKCSELTFDSKDFYKNLNIGRERYGTGFSGFLRGDWGICIKKDLVTKSGTLEYFINKHSGEKIRICDANQFTYLKKSVTTWGTRDSITNGEECCNFLFDSVDILSMSNADTPKEWLVSAERKVTSTDDDNIRVYYRSGYTLSRFRDRKEPKEKGIIIYSRHTREDEELRALGGLVDSYGGSKITLVMSCKECLIKTLENKKRYISVTDFLTEKQTFFVKAIEAGIIYANFEKRTDFRKLPIWTKFCQDYKGYLGVSLSEFRNLEKAYLDNGWIRQWKIDQYLPDTKDLTVYQKTHTIQELAATINDYSDKILSNPTYKRMAVHLANNLELFADTLALVPKLH